MRRASSSKAHAEAGMFLQSLQSSDTHATSMQWRNNGNKCTTESFINSNGLYPPFAFSIYELDVTNAAFYNLPDFANLVENPIQIESALEGSGEGENGNDGPVDGVVDMDLELTDGDLCPSVNRDNKHDS